MQTLFIDDRSRMETAAATWIAESVQAGVLERGHCSLMLAGGDSLRSVYERLAVPSLTGRVTWGHVIIYFGDERCVPPDDPESNFRMANEVLLRHLPIPGSQIHRMEGENPDPDESARAYERLLPDGLDVLLLGMGSDGHTASLFPDSPAIRERVRRVMPSSSPRPPTQRITVTPVIRSARAVAVIVSGAGKAAAVARAFEGPLQPERCPVQLALDRCWFLDRAAAQHLAHGIA